ncbi:GIDE domain-containing protein [Haloarcula sp. 1CSR25-25]|uniref:GIDE domain-containing protein n=1 Tax=Haloarcula sp. 1CSR25-25 TaxID=2862545 RepID=UPI002893BA63|nr:GIDE domain-containing protein [Haloarcula sp. 1CSR25-25]MDT3436298.1 E3 ubiquitin ligase family protein [Haloarcula sp. 1CSR25-25]
MVLPQLVAIAFLAVGGFVLVRGSRDLRTVAHILRNDPVPVRSLDGHTGPVEITGTAVADEDTGTVTAPFTGSECLAYTYEVEEYRSSGKHSHWKTLDEGQAGVDFVVDDGTDRVRVNPDGADVRFESQSVTVSPGTELPERLADYVERTEAVEAQDGSVNLLVTEISLGNRQRFTERRLDVGEDVYVYGQATRGPATEWGSNLVDAIVGDGDGTPVFVISDTSERGTAWRIARGAITEAVFGLLAAVIGAVVLLSVQ